MADGEEVFYAPLNSGDNSEYYQLTQCCNNLPVEMDGLPVRFKFVGAMSNSIHPDDLFGKVLSKITDVNQNEYTGCFTLTDATCVAEYKTIDWEEFFFKVDTVKTCLECLPVDTTVVLQTNTTVIYAEPDYNGLDPDVVENTMCSFGDIMYKEMMTKRNGIVYCCMDNKLDVMIDHQILKMDLVDNSEICCPVT